jgi:hypothetical protein
MDRMRTPLLISLIHLLSSGAALAANEVAQANQQPASSAAPPAGSAAPAAAPAAPVDKVTPEPLPPPPPGAIPPAATSDPTAATQVIGAGTSRPVIVEPPAPTEAASITEVGVQRLPGYAYPEDKDQLRGIAHGSLWLTFHGKQWPYMPSFTGDKRFVIGLSGWGWIDNSYQKFSPWGLNPNIEKDRVRYWRQQARMLLRVTPTYSLGGGHFIQGQVELVGTGDQTLLRTNIGGQDTDDLWLRVGKWNKWDLMAGRFEGWEVFHLGMGLDFNTFERIGAVGPGEVDNQISFYGLTDNQFRPSGAAGNLAFHYYPLRILRFELLGMSGSFSGPAYGTRPVAILDLGWLKLKGGVEYQKLLSFNPASDKTDVTSKGVGGAIQFVFAPHVEFGLNAAQGTVWSIDNRGGVSPTGSYTRTSLGAFANVSNGSARHPLLFGVGSLMTWTENQNSIQPNPVDSYWLYQGFIAAQYVVQGSLYIKLVGGYSRGHWSLAGNDPRIEFDNEVYSARLRFSFYF